MFQGKWLYRERLYIYCEILHAWSISILAALFKNLDMTRHVLIIILFFYSFSLFAQTKMRTIQELINTTDPGWAIVEQMIDSATNKVEVLPVDTNNAKNALYKTQVTTRSPMGAIIYMTGGILIDNGWIRILGSGSNRLTRTLPDWNKGKSITEFGQPAPFLLIADDAMGGFFLLNGGGLGEDLGKTYYLSADNLEYEPLGLSYTDFLYFCFNDNLDEFYKGYRWTNWNEEVSKLEGDKVFSFFPYLWTEEGKDINKNHRKAVPIEELYHFHLDLRKQLGISE